MLIEHIEKSLNINIQDSKLEKLILPECEQAGVTLYVKRDDLIHPIISGNKWRKLKYILEHALSNNHQHLISMGGPYSNHLHALAYIGNQLNIKTTAYIRGEEIQTQTLSDMQTWGMDLIYVDRNTFRKLRNYKDYDCDLAKKHNGYWIPEGGSNPLALKGVTDLVNEINIEFDVLALSCGTGTTLAGITKEVNKQNILGFSSFKGKDFLSDDIKQTFSINKDNWSINNDYHFGGFGQYNETLLNFMQKFNQQNNIPLEQVYTGKLFYGLIDLIIQNHFQKETTIVVLHTGGLQGKLNLSI